jgi:hypothetical protein
MNLPVKRVYQLKAQSIVRLRASLQRRTMRDSSRDITRDKK